jgi:hypothetical protein
LTVFTDVNARRTATQGPDYPPGGTGSATPNFIGFFKNCSTPLFGGPSASFDEAIEHGRQAILPSPKSEKASFVFFQVLWRAGQRIEALDEVKRLTKCSAFLAIGPSKVYSDMIEGLELIMSDEENAGEEPTDETFPRPS